MLVSLSWLLLFSLYLVINLLNLLTCLCLTLLNLSSLTLLMNSMHLSCVVIVVGNDNSLDLLFSNFLPLFFKMTFMDLTLSWSSCFSALMIISLAFLVMSFLVDPNLTLTEITPLLTHLNVNILWFLKLLSLIMHFYQSHSSCKASIPWYSWINFYRFLIPLIIY